MATLKRVGPGSAFKVGLITYGILGLFMGLLMALVSGLVGAVAPPAPTGNPAAALFRLGMGVGAIVFLPLFYGVIGGIFAAIGAFVYNLVAAWVGGLDIDIG